MQPRSANVLLAFPGPPLFLGLGGKEFSLTIHPRTIPYEWNCNLW